MGSRLREKPERILECLVEVSAPKDRNSDPQIVSIYPKDVDEGSLKLMPHFCFPYDILSSYNPAGQLFTFVWTDLESKYRFGFCRHPPGAQTCLCILSYLPWFEVFYPFLNTLGEMKAKKQENDAMLLVEALYAYEVPSPYTEVTIKTQIEGTSFTFTAPNPNGLPSLTKSRNLQEYYNSVDSHTMMVMFASLLYERRVLVTSKKLSLLTAIVHSAATLMYPLYWQHLFIPVIPPKLLDYCGAPMPFLIGVHSSLMNEVRASVGDQNMDIVILDADTNTIETPFDDFESLPSEINEKLKSRLKKTEKSMDDGLARIFLKALVALLGGYRSALKLHQGENISFDQDSFVQAKSGSMRRILEKMMTFQHVRQFIDGRLDMLNAGKGFNDIFEEECDLAEHDKDKWKNKYTLWMKESFNKANPAMKKIYKETKAKVKIVHKRFSQPKSKEVEDIPTSSSRMRSLQYLDIPDGFTQKSAPTSPAKSRTIPPQRPPPPRPPPFEMYNEAYLRDRTRPVSAGPVSTRRRTTGSKEAVKRYNPVFVPDSNDSNGQSEHSSSNGEDNGQEGNWNLMSDFNDIFSKLDKGLMNTSSSEASDTSFQRDQRHTMPVSPTRQYQRSSNAFTSTNPIQGLSNIKDDDQMESNLPTQRKNWETFDETSPIPPSRLKRDRDMRDRSLTASDTHLAIRGGRKEGPPVPPRPLSVSLQRRTGVGANPPQKYASMRKSVVKIQVTATSPTDCVESRPPPPASLIDAPIPTSFSTPSLVERDAELSPVTKEFTSQQELLADYGLNLDDLSIASLKGRKSDSSNNNPGFSTQNTALSTQNTALSTQNTALSTQNTGFPTQNRGFSNPNFSTRNPSLITQKNQGFPSRNNSGFTTQPQPLASNNIKDLLTNNPPLSNTTRGMSTMLQPSVAPLSPSRTVPVNTASKNSKTAQTDPFADLVSLTKASVAHDKPLDAKKTNTFGNYGQ